MEWALPLAFHQVSGAAAPVAAAAPVSVRSRLWAPCPSVPLSALRLAVSDGGASPPVSTWFTSRHTNSVGRSTRVATADRAGSATLVARTRTSMNCARLAGGV